MKTMLHGLALLITSIATGNVFAQGNIIKANVLSAAAKTANVSYERVLLMDHGATGIQLTGFYTSIRHDNDHSQKIDGFGGQLEIRHYFHDSLPKGPFIAYSFRRARYDQLYCQCRLNDPAFDDAPIEVRYAVVDSKGYFTTTGVGIDVGYQKLILGRVTAEIFVGLGLYMRRNHDWDEDGGGALDIDIPDWDTFNNGLALRVGARVGWAFGHLKYYRQNE